MGTLSAREIEFNNTIEDYYDSLSKLILGDDDGLEYLFLVDNDQIVDRVAKNNMARWHILSPIEVASFLHALAKVIGYFQLLESKIPQVYGGNFISERIEKIGIMPFDGGSQVYDHFRRTIVDPTHTKLFSKILRNQELVYWLRKYYVLYSSMLSNNQVSGSDRIEMKVALGVIMVHFLTLGIRPYMLEEDSAKRQNMLENGHDWVYELSELFGDFSQTSDRYFGFQNLVQNCHEYAGWLHEKKMEKVAKKAADILIQKTCTTPPPPAA